MVAVIISKRFLPTNRLQYDHAERPDCTRQCLSSQMGPSDICSVVLSRNSLPRIPMHQIQSMEGHYSTTHRRPILHPGIRNTILRGVLP
jgi:hypothetical protein